VLAGGTDLIPSMRQKLFEPEYVLDLRGVAQLRGIRLEGGAVEIGALTALSAIENSAYLRQHFPVLTQAAATVASPVLRNMGTLGGNICLDTRCLWYNQSLTWRKGCGFCIKKDGDLCHVAPGGTKCWAAFSGDTPPALLCLKAEIEIAGPNGTRRIPLQEFYTGDGENYRKLLPNELVTRVFLSAESADYRGVYRKLRVRGSIDYPLAGVAVVMKRSNGHVSDARIAMTAVNPAPLTVRVWSILLPIEDAKICRVREKLMDASASVTPGTERNSESIFSSNSMFCSTDVVNGSISNGEVHSAVTDLSATM